MASSKTDAQERFIAEPGACDLSRASYSEQLSAIGIDETGVRFQATTDQVAFKSVFEIVTTVLRANGYAFNLENVLASLDTFRIGVRVRLPPSGAHQPPQGPLTPRAFAPSVQFDLPTRHRVGPLLQSLYEEIRAYEAEIARLHDAGAGKSSEAKGKSIAQLRRDLQRLEEENEGLRAKLAELAQTVSALQRSHADASRALADQNLLPANVRIATVRQVDLPSRHVTLRAGRASFGAPLAYFDSLPSPGMQCLVVVNDGSVDGVFLHERAGTPPALRVGRVLYVDGSRCKIRDDTRRTWVFAAHNRVEQAVVDELHRGGRVLLYLCGDALVRLEPCHPAGREPPTWRVQEALALHQIRHDEAVEAAAEPGPTSGLGGEGA